MPKLVLIDANSLIHRAFHALPPLTTPQGEPIGAVYGFTTMLLRVLDDLKPEYAMVVWDTPKPTFRHEAFIDYKAQRPETDVNLKAQFEPARKVVESLNIPQYSQEGFEADDLIGSLAKQVTSNESDIEVTIVTGDLDDLQLVDEKISVFTTQRGFSDTIIYTAKEVQTRYEGLTPQQLIEYKALAGDQSDNIPGVKGIGKKTAIELVNQYKDLDTIYEHINDLKPRQAKLLTEGKTNAYLSRDLGRIVTTVPVVIDLHHATISNFDAEKAKNTFITYGFKSLLGRIDKLAISPKEGKLIEEINVITPEITNIREILENLNIPWHEINNQSEFSVPIAVNVLTGKTLEHLGWEELCGFYLKVKVSAFDLLSISQRQDLFFALQTVIRQEIDKAGNEKLKELIDKVEFPLQKILSKMSIKGILVNRELLENLKSEFEQRLLVCEKEIYRLVGHEFNLNSPKQLEEVLFDQLGLPAIKKTKTQRSTDESVLLRLKEIHPMVNKLLGYRSDFKIKSTYLEPLLEYTKDDSRVHTTYLQTNTASGRLSSINPNMQNMPIDDEYGLRQIFIASPGTKLVIADYSQIELRIMAHYCRDENLINSFIHDQDIHTATAARIFNKYAAEVTSKERKIAKTINFALMYGMSAHGLSESLSIPVFEAKTYIDNFFASYPNVKKWQTELLNQARSTGYVETMFGRRRYISELLAGNFHVRSAGERAAINHPLQGTQADILKMAMIRIDSELFDSGGHDQSMLLQVHDELVFEVPVNDVPNFAQKIKQIMETIITLAVPIKVEVAVGENWRDTEVLSL